MPLPTVRSLPPCPIRQRFAGSAGALVCLARVMRQLLCALLLVAGPLLAQAQDQIRAQAVLEDPGAAMTIEQVAASQAFVPLDGMLVGGYTDSVFWLRLQVLPEADKQTLRLRVRPTFVDDLRLYQQDAQGRWQVRVSGDRHPYERAQRSISALGFDIAPEGPTTYYLRLRTSSSAMLHVQALDVSEAARKDALLIFFQVAYMAFMGAVLVWSGRAWWRGRERAMGAFALYQACNLVHAMALMGYYSPFAGASAWADALTSVFVLATAGSGFVFHAVTLGLYGPAPWLLRGLWALAAGVPVLLGLYFAGHDRLALQLNALAVLLCGVLMLLLSLSARREDLPGLRVLRTVYSLQALSIAASMLPFLGWVRAVEWSLQSSLVHGLISASLMAYMLHQRSRLLQAQGEDSRQRAVLAEQRLQLQAEQVAAQERFIDVLTHELKTPISVALMSLGAVQTKDRHTERARRAMGNLDAIVERTRLSVLADSRRLQAQMAPCNVSVLVYECIEDCRAPERVQATVGFELEACTDAQLLGLIVTNLIDNALKYSPPDSAVSVWLDSGLEDDRPERPKADGDEPVPGTRGAPWLCLRVVNAVGAAGVPDASRLFEKYYRSPGAQSHSGSGLGLYLSQHLAALMGARLHHRQLPVVPPGTGLQQVEFTLVLPTSRESHP